MNPTYDLTVYDTAVRDHEYIFDHFTITPTSTGTMTFDFQYSTSEGCDSIVHLMLYVLDNIGVQTVWMPNIEVFPNPAQSTLNIKGENMQRFWIYDDNGRLVFSKNEAVTDLQRVDVSHLAPGQYFVKVQFDNNRTVTRKFVVNRQ